MKKHLSKFKIGDKVQCCAKPPKEAGENGAGWGANYTFTVTEITADGSNYIYWRGKDECGVYEYALSLINSARSGEVKLTRY